MAGSSASDVVIEPWGEGDLELLRRINAPEMMEHLGGPESEEKVLDRHRRYLEARDLGPEAMFRIVVLPEREAVGNIGYWEREWRGETVYETGWCILPEFSGRGVATAAGRLVVERARARRRHRYLHAYPSVDHPASNAICRKLGFTLLGACDFEYPPGHLMRCNDWRLEL
ncbi:GNAT family N-acetyltransferase [Actinoallomurus rhizosphaericola]|uniref:GNAT family N-acetyltransferase n=1 Tax=Actinoallomurus rhizosphaericola TaxID=2952536 RepID=UPI0020915729|nr:GNAT family N-acetyltransferase [Actinoallomurus rhizosphaericola]MCO5992920.1 GNAT family N-acetyltransferase [Actinoallomurus rhizosphaericola]